MYDVHFVLSQEIIILWFLCRAAFVANEIPLFMNQSPPHVWMLVNLALLLAVL